MSEPVHGTASKAVALPAEATGVSTVGLSRDVSPAGDNQDSYTDKPTPNKTFNDMMARREENSRWIIGLGALALFVVAGFMSLPDSKGSPAPR
jgi:hypothetical protein